MNAAPAKHGSKPDFLSVGPEKTGTTWIDRQLRQHPEIWLPHVKELSFFWEDLVFPEEGALARLRPSEDWHHQRYRQYLGDRLRHYVRYPASMVRDRSRLSWDLRYLFARHDVDWYRSSFAEAGDRLAGDISPQYFFMRESQVQKIHRACPDAKVIITLRNPPEWIWSFARMKIKKRGFERDGHEIDEFVDRKIANNSFSRSCETWRDIYPEGQVGIFFFETLQRDPWRFYSDICAFLGIEPREELRGQLAQRVNPGQAEEVPERLREKIADGWRKDVERLARQLGSLPPEWLDASPPQAAQYQFDKWFEDNG